MKINSKYFSFNEQSKSINNIDFSSYFGWSGLNVTKFIIPEASEITNFQLNHIFPDLKEKEKIFVIIKGNIDFKSNDLDATLNELDAVDIISKTVDYNFKALSDASIFMISSVKSKISEAKTIKFNFKKDIEARNLWGGQIISRPYEGKELTVVLFDLKSGFKFNDKGHANEQITWLINGEMDFYSNSQKKKLTSDAGVSIGPNHEHGGVSGGALGFDAFFPKRTEKKYKKELSQ